jgi:rhamnosyl/mannosyltransferase
VNDTVKVLHVYRTYFPDLPGGLQEAIRQICISTKALEVESKIFTLSPTPEPTRISRDEGEVFRCRSIAAPASCDFSGPSSIREFKALVEWADIVHFHFPWPFLDILNLFISKNKPRVMTYHSDIVRQKLLGKLYKPLMKKTLRSMDAIVATSDNYARTSGTLNGYVDKSQLHIIPLGIRDYYQVQKEVPTDDTHLLVKHGLEKGKFAFTIGVLRYYKGFHTLVEAAKSTSYKIVISGSGYEANNLKRQVEESGLKNVIFTGQLTESEKFVLLDSCGVFVLTSHLRSEAFGMVLVEASMFKKPMITCEIGTGTSFVNSHEETGIVVEPEKPDQIADAINKLIEDTNLANQYGQRARERYIELFSDISLGCNYKKLYSRILE